MWKVHQASAPGPVLAVNGPQAPEEFVPKQLTYELFGSLGDGGMLDYVDIDGHPHKVDLTTLPWSQTETTTLTVASGSISAQVHGASTNTADERRSLRHPNDSAQGAEARTDVG
jgi:hypothetical protein